MNKTDRWTDRRTNGRTDIASYRDACPHLKSGEMCTLVCVRGRAFGGMEGGLYAQTYPSATIIVNEEKIHIHVQLVLTTFPFYFPDI